MLGWPAGSKAIGTYGTIQHAVFRAAHDARTVTVDIAGVPPIIGEGIAVRIRGIRVPEVAGRCDREVSAARAGRDIVRQLLSRARNITLQDVGRDRVFRLTAVVLADNVDIRTVLINKGLAVWETESRHGHDWCGNGR